MAFNSIDFIVFLLTLFYISGTYLFRRNIFSRNLILLVFSYVFYGYGNPYLLLFILYSTIIDFYIGRKIYESSDSIRRKRLLYISLVSNIGLLFVIKYTGWLSSLLSDSLVILLGSKYAFEPIYFLLPPGISFYTFQTLSYTIDIYGKKLKPEKNIINYSTYVTFFPQLVAGPIERASILLPQFKNLTATNKKIIKSSLILISYGLVKKIVFADNFGVIVEQGIKHSIMPGVGYVVVLAFALQIYCDFSAYTDIARGTARLFGFNLSKNFMTPYFSSSPSEFWRRWHISLSSWLRDYLYIPLGGDRNGRYARNILITMCLGGLWHGAGFYFLLWGFYQGILIVFYRKFPIDEYLIKKYKKLGKVLSIFIMFHFILFGWLLFMTPDMPTLLSLGYSLVRLVIEPFNTEVLNYIYILLVFAIPIFFTELIGYLKHTEFVNLISDVSDQMMILFLICSFYLIIFIGKREAYDFIYFAF